MQFIKNSLKLISKVGMNKGLIYKNIQVERITLSFIRETKTIIDNKNMRICTWNNSGNNIFISQTCLVEGELGSVSLLTTI